MSEKAARVDRGEAEPRSLRIQAIALRDAADALDHAADAIEFAPPPGSPRLGGRKLIAALDELVEPGEAVHYRDAHRRLIEAGVSPRGKDAANTLLSCLARSPYYSRVAPRSGEWRRHAPEA